MNYIDRERKEKQLKVVKEGLEKDNKCPMCQGIVHVKHGRFEKFVGCSNFPECHFAWTLDQAATRFKLNKKRRLIERELKEKAMNERPAFHRSYDRGR